MKKLLVLPLMSFASLQCFASGSGNSADAINGIITLVAIVFGVLNLILFFKVWGMTNDVKKITDMLTIQYGFNETGNKSHKGLPPKPSTQQKKKKTSNKDSDNDPLMSFYDDCTELFSSCKSKEEFDAHVDEILEQYKKTTGNDFSYLKKDLWDQLKQL